MKVVSISYFDWNAQFSWHSITVVVFSFAISIILLSNNSPATLLSPKHQLGVPNKVALLFDTLSSGRAQLEGGEKNK